jgi:hypothetical protein
MNDHDLLPPLVRRAQAGDRDAFAAVNADVRVVEFLPGALSRDESDALAARIEAHFGAHGFGLWDVEISGVTPFAGFIGLSVHVEDRRLDGLVIGGLRGVITPIGAAASENPAFAVPRW